MLSILCMTMMTSALVIQISCYGIGGLLRRNLFQQQQNNQNQGLLNNFTLNNSVQSFSKGSGTVNSLREDGYMASHSSHESGEMLLTINNNDIDNISTKTEGSCDELLEEDAHDGKEIMDDRRDRKESGMNALIPFSDVELAFEESFSIIQKSNEAIIKTGWKLVHENELYTLFKRRGKDDSGREEKGPVEYMMKGIVDDVSPRNFLHAQTNKVLRQGWDKTMSDMVTNEEDPHSLDKYVLEGDDESEDTLYYRTKWPWPLKDRDYTLARRVHFKNDEGKEAVVFVSKATNDLDVPKKDGVIRVENYWCRSAYFAIKAPPSSSSKRFEGSKVGEEKHLKGKSNGLKHHHPVHLSGVSTSQVINSTFQHEQDSRIRGDDVRNKLEAMFSRSSLSADKSVFDQIKVPKLKKLFPGGHGENQRRGLTKSPSREQGLSPYDVKGTRFVTIFCDDSKVPLPSRVVDMISTQAEKVVPDSMRSLHEAAVSLQEKKM